MADLPAPRPTPRPAVPDETREAILAAALRIFSRDGFVQATVRDIAAAAAVNQALLFRLCPSKKALFLETFRHAGARAGQRLDRMATATAAQIAGLPLPEALAVLINAGYRLGYAEIELLRLVILSQPFVPELNAEATHFPEQMQARLAQTLAQAGVCGRHGITLAQVSTLITHDILRTCLDLYLHEDRTCYDTQLEADLAPRRATQAALFATMLRAG